MTEPRDTPNPATSTQPGRSSGKVEGAGGSKLLPILLGLLLLAVLVGLLLFFLLRDNDDDGDVAAPVASSSASLTPSPSVEPEPSDTLSPSIGPTEVGIPDPSSSPIVTQVPGSGTTLRADSEDVVAAAGGGQLAALVGTPVEGFATVQEVVADEGFWVGSDATERVYVYLTKEARDGGGESVPIITVGDTVSLTGTVTTLAEQPDATAGVITGQGKAQLSQQGALILATSYAVS